MHLTHIETRDAQLRQRILPCERAKAMSENTPDFRQISEQLYRALKSVGCRCTEPVWWDKEKRPAHKCSLCIAREAYEAAAGIKPNG
jgi:hypothetical protein